MMKRKVIAALIPALLSITAANASEIYNKDGNKLDLQGKVNVSHQMSNDKANDGDMSYARLGFKGQTKISDELTGYGMWQYQYQLNNSEGSDAQNNNRTRLGFAGLKYANLGSLDYGRNYGLIYDVLGYADMLPKFGGDAAFSDGFLAGRSGGVATWRNQDFFGLVKGLSIAAQYQGKNERSATQTDALRRSNGEGYATSLQYSFDFGLSLVGAYANLDRTAAQNTALRGDGEKAELWAGGIKYDANQIYLASIYGETRNATPIPRGYANKATNFEAVAQYQFLNGFRPSLAYVSSRGQDVENIGSVDIYKYVSVGAYYYFNKNMNIYAEYKINLLQADNKLGLANDDISVVGLTYQF
ncbi:porin OmpC [Izhakiella australiensis]|uniref:Porin OmpC n=1 Tax=Izhakiella australiensis TaxID=1926881 RepID=A0A1S8YQD2_9GAMM|nr:porin [Izhakiella australiensis]OON41280.1 porin OmpC [Izhakiella australiensis]